MKWLLRAFTGFLSALPLSWALAIGRGLGWVYGNVIRYHRKEALDALQRAFPGQPVSELKGIRSRMYRNLGMNLVELCRLPRATDTYLSGHIGWVNEEHVRNALAGGKGLIALTGHIGNWDLLCTVTPRRGYPLTIITKDIKNAAVNEFWMNLRHRYGLKYVPAHNSYRECLKTLKRNESVGFILDQNMTRDEGIFVDFFGRSACTSPGLAFMSAQSGAPVVPVWIVRCEGGRHEVHFLPPIEPPPDRKPETVREYTQKYTAVLEQIIRQQPDQWIWIHRRWRTQPPGAGGTRLRQGYGGQASNVEHPTSNPEPEP
jgi:Kdo2-lipid IVA lauroyltransferase/acyltransferase